VRKLADGRTNSEYGTIVVMARRPDRKKAEMLSEDDLRELRHNLAHLSVGAVRDFYDQAYRDCRLIYRRLSHPETNTGPRSSLEAVVEVAVMTLPGNMIGKRLRFAGRSET
jgi:hypothetical protein